jgi:hypothetical protein
MKPQPEQTEFIILTDDNVEEIATELEAGNGIILIADPKYWGSHPDQMDGRFEMHLFDRPTIDAKKERIIAPRGTKKVGDQDWQTGWENDRQYCLCERSRPTQKREDDGLHKQLARLYGQPDNLDELYATASSFFERLPVGDFEFDIYMQNSASHHLGRNKYSRWQAYYIPRLVSPAAGLTHALTWMLDQWNAQKPLEGWAEQFKFTKQHIEAMVNYALEDLKTGKVLAHNVKAGMSADALVGLA